MRNSVPFSGLTAIYDASGRGQAQEAAITLDEAAALEIQRVHPHVGLMLPLDVDQVLDGLSLRLEHLHGLCGLTSFS
jgi:hypothetical protein